MVREEEMTYAAVAATLGIAIKSVDDALLRATATVRDKLTKYLEDGR